MDAQFFQDTFQFIPGGRIPLYEQLASYFRIQIQAQNLVPGDKLIPEEDLCEMLRISRTTVRQAVNLLVEEGLVYRHRGKGTFVAEQKLRRTFNHLYSFSEDVRNLGRTPKSIVIAGRVEELQDSRILELLNMPCGQKQVFHLERVRCADDVPLLVEDTYIPLFLCPGIQSNDFGSKSLYETLQKEYSLSPWHAKEVLEAINIPQKEAGLLHCRVGQPGYKIHRISNLDNGVVFEFTSSVTRADRCVFEFDMFSGDAGKNSSGFQRYASL